jgi:hypothetical protein
MAKASKKKKALPKRIAKTRAKNVRFRATKAKKKPGQIDRDTIEKRAKAYRDMESHVCDLVNMGTIAMDQFDNNEGLFTFAVGKLEDMLNEFKAHYYTEEFPL